MSALLPGFEPVSVDVGDVRVTAEVGGSGPPVLLLHGYPQNHLMWHGVAPALAEGHTVVAADLRGYGDSSAPPSQDGQAYSKRLMAADQVGLMRQLGHERFAAVGHDRGARVVHRMCLDAPEAVTRAAVLDVVPTRHVFGHVDRALASTYYHWFFLTQPADLPEQLIGGAPSLFLRRQLAAWSGGHAFDPRAVDDYLRCFAQPERIAATCEDYRAAAGVDLEHDEVDAAAGRRVGCPLLVLWGEKGFVGQSYDVLDVWRQYADDVRGHALDCLHFLPEERPRETAAALQEFLG